MAKQIIQLGSTANDHTGDPLRVAFTKVNDNFSELYTAVAASQPNLATVATTGSYTDLIDRPTIPTDINQLSDSSSLLGQGSANTGDIRFNGSWIKNVDAGNIYISPQDGNSWLNLPSDAQLSESNPVVLGAVGTNGYAQIVTGTGNTWSFGTDGTTTIPGSIRSSGNSLSWSTTITNITTGSNDTEVSLLVAVFGAPIVGQVTISGVNGTYEANGTWWYQATSPGSFRLYNDQALNNPVDSTTWTAYVDSGTAADIGGQGFTIEGTNGNWTFDADSTLRIPGNLVLGAGNNNNGHEQHLIIDSSNYWTSIQWKNFNSPQDPNSTPFECQAQLLRVFATENTVTSWCNVQNPREELVAVTAVRPNGTNYNGLMLSTSDGKIPDAPYNDGSGTRYNWIMGGDGKLTLPSGGTIGESGSPTGLGQTIELTPFGGNDSNQMLKIYPTVAEGNHLHLTSGDLSVTSLFLGNDSQYVRTRADGAIVIGTSDAVPDMDGYGKRWVFDVNGTLILPASNSITTETTVGLSTGTEITGISFDTAGNGMPYQYVIIGGNAQFNSWFSLGAGIVGYKVFTTGNPGSMVTVINFLDQTLGGPSIEFDGSMPAAPWTVQSPDYVAGVTTYQPLNININNNNWNFNPDGTLSATCFLALTGTSGTGYSFQNDGGYDTGMFSTQDGYVQFYSNSQEVFNFNTDRLEFNKPVTLGLLTTAAQTGTHDPVYPTAIDLTKTINKLGDNSGSSYSLADGQEGQIMYLVRKHDVTDLSMPSIQIHVDNAYYGLNQAPNQILYFNSEIITLIFTDGAWQQTGGLWD